MQALLTPASGMLLATGSREGVAPLYAGGDSVHAGPEPRVKLLWSRN